MNSHHVPGFVRYKIEIGQRYVPADGSGGSLIVTDVTKYADCDDIVVYDTIKKSERRIDAFKLAMVRYTLSAEPLPKDDEA
jgi:hypothetical protein